MLDKLGSLTPPIESVLDLLGHYPRRYHDRTHQSDIADHLPYCRVISSKKPELSSSLT